MDEIMDFSCLENTLFNNEQLINILDNYSPNSPVSIEHFVPEKIFPSMNTLTPPASVEQSLLMPPPSTFQSTATPLQPVNPMMNASTPLLQVEPPLTACPAPDRPLKVATPLQPVPSMDASPPPLRVNPPLKTTYPPRPLTVMERTLPLKPQQKRKTATPVERTLPLKPQQKSKAATPVERTLPLKPLQKRKTTTPVEKTLPLKPLQKRKTATPVEKTLPLKPQQRRKAASPVEKTIPVLPQKKIKAASPVEKTLPVLPLSPPARSLEKALKESRLPKPTLEKNVPMPTDPLKRKAPKEWSRVEMAKKPLKEVLSQKQIVKKGIEDQNQIIHGTKNPFPRLKNYTIPKLKSPDKNNLDLKVLDGVQHVVPDTCSKLPIDPQTIDCLYSPDTLILCVEECDYDML